MAQSGPQRNTIATITDRKGRVILKITQKEYLVRDSKGSFTSYSEYNNIILEDGVAWNPAMLSQKPPVHIAVCDVCRKRRRPKTYGLVTVAGGKICVCGRLCCPKHRRQSLDDRKWRCPSCHRRHRMKILMTPVFFRRQEPEA